MAVTDEFKQDVLEVLDEYTAQLENQSGPNATPIMPISDVDKTVSMPAVKFDSDPRVNSRATPQGYYQIPVSDFYALIDALAQEVSIATDDLVELKAATDQARQDTIAATEDAETATSGAENVDASLVGMTVTVTDRTGVSTSVNIGFEIFRTYKTKAAMRADAANVPEGRFVMIGNTDDPTDPDNATLWSRTAALPADTEHTFSLLSDLDQASSAAWADWLNNMKPAIEAATNAANTAASNANQKASLANTAATNADNSRLAIEANEQTRQQNEQARVSAETQRQSDWAAFFSDTLTTGCRKLWSDFWGSINSLWTGFWGESASDPNGVRKQWSDLHAQAAQDHQTATADTGQAAQDHQTAVQDHQTAVQDHSTATQDHSASTQATADAEAQTAILEEWNTHQPYIGDGTTGDANYWYIWDTDNDAYVRSVYAKGDDLHWEEMSETEKEDLAQRVLANLVFASVQTCEDIIDEIT